MCIITKFVMYMSSDGANFIVLKVFDLEHVLQSYTSLVFIYKLHTMSVKLLTVIMYLMTCINGSNGC